MRRRKILLLESDKGLRNVLSLSLDAYEVNPVGTISEADGAMRAESFDLAIVDVVSWQHSLEGIELIRSWRKAGERCPIIAVSGAGDARLAVLTLNAGADDFMRKPIRGAELLARIECRLRRGEEAASSHKAGGIYLNAKPFTFGRARIHPDLTIRFKAGCDRLLPKQFGILRCFHSNLGKLVLKQDLLREVWGPGVETGSASVHEYISRLRKLYAAHGENLDLLVSQEKKGRLARVRNRFEEAGAMNADPTILLLDDESLQLLTMRAQLRGLGRLMQFTEPWPALDFARREPIDAAVVDIRMPGQTMDGLDFLRALRSFDADVSVIIRTADQSEDIADGAIELRAMRRFIKSRTSMEEFHRFTLAAIAETRARRHQAKAVQETEESRRKLLEALGTYDVTITSATVHRGIIQSMRNNLTAIDLLAHKLRGYAREYPQLADLTAQNETVVGRMITEIDAFLDGPFNTSSNAPTVGVNEMIHALRTHFVGATEWLSVGKKVSVGNLASNAFVACPPLPLLNALKHLAEFCLSRMAAGSELTLTSVPFATGKEALAHPVPPQIVLNRGALPANRPCVLFRFRAEMPPCPATELQEILEPKVSAARTANMCVVHQALALSGGALVFLGDGRDHMRVEAILPIAIE